MLGTIFVLSLSILLPNIAIAQGVVDDNHRVDCFPDPAASQQACEARGCIWTPAHDQNDPTVPWCYFPANTGYTLSSNDGTVFQLAKNPSVANPFGEDFATIKLTTATIGKTLNVRIGVDGRYEPPVDLPKNPSISSDTLGFSTSTTSNGIFAFNVTRTSSGTALWDTSIGGLLFADKYIQIATLLPSDTIYGFGENTHPNLKHDLSQYITWSFFARDQPPNSGGLSTINLYGVHPFYMCLESDGQAHGVLILNSNAQEVTTGPGPHLVYRTIGGMLDMYFFPGPAPEDVINQYLALIGTPFLPAYWSLGFQICRYGYRDLDEMKAVVQRTQEAGVPLDVTFADIDYMDRYKDFTTGPVSLHRDGLHLTLIFDPAIEVTYDTFQRGMAQGARFIEWDRADQVMRPIQDLYPLARDTKIMLGVVWPDAHVSFPDFLDPTNVTAQWWADEFTRYHDQVAFDGIWIDMNEPANFGTNSDHPWYFDNPDHPNDAPLFCPMSGPDSEFDAPPYRTKAAYNFNAPLCDKTLCMLARTAGGTQRLYDTKNLYGWSEARATIAALHQATGKRGTVISRSTFPSSGRYGGHWLGDNTARWDDLRTSVIGAMEFNMFGIPYIGSDICGFQGSTDEELCLRWHQMGAFHSFARNHNNNGAPPQDPAIWPSVAAAARKAFLFRYQYLPYLFSLHFDSSMSGHTVIRPLFFEFVNDTATRNISYQFMWGSGMLITPVVDQGASTVRGYFPSAIWYSLYDVNYGRVQEPGFSSLSAPTTALIPVHARGGYILPRQAANTTTTASRNNPFELLIPLDPMRSASGQLFWDDGDSVPPADLAQHNFFAWQFAFSATDDTAQLTISSTKSAQDLAIPTLDILEILGYNLTPNFNSFTLNGSPITINTQTSSYNSANRRLFISTSRLIDLSAVTPGNDVRLQWNHS